MSANEQGSRQRPSMEMATPPRWPDDISPEPILSDGGGAAARPSAAPPFPTTTGAAVVAGGEIRESSGQLQIGTRVMLNGVGSTSALAGQQGSITAVHLDSYAITLDGGLQVSNAKKESVVQVPNGTEVRDEPATTGQQGAEEFYAPFAIGGSAGKAQQQAGRIKDALNKAYGMQAMVSSWASLYWQAIKNEQDIYGLDPSIVRILQGHGYFGPGTVGPPRYEELKKQLQEFETLGGPQHDSAGSLLKPMTEEEVHDPEQLSWHLRLPPDLQRAAPELYRNIRAEGVNSVRQWVNEQHPSLEQKNSTQYQDLFMAATIIDYELAECKSEQALTHKLATSDSLEIHLRKLGSFIYYRRTKDKTGAQRMLGVRAPGTGADIAPKWMIDDANVHSKAEYQRVERGHKMNRFESGGSGARDGGGGKGRGQKGGRGGKANKKGGQTTQG